MLLLASTALFVGAAVAAHTGSDEAYAVAIIGAIFTGLGGLLNLYLTAQGRRAQKRIEPKIDHAREIATDTRHRLEATRGELGEHYQRVEQRQAEGARVGSELVETMKGLREVIAQNRKDGQS